MSNEAQFVIIVEDNGTVTGHEFVTVDTANTIIDTNVATPGRSTFTLGTADWFFNEDSTGDHNDTAAQGGNEG